MASKNILLATRPLSPPWDEASKNFAYFLTKSIRDPEFHLHILTDGAPLDDVSLDVMRHPIYPKDSSGRAGFPFKQKSRLPIHLVLEGEDYDIIHYIFTPTKLSSFIIKRFVSKKPKTIQTIATLREDILKPNDWRKLFFADRLVVYSDYSKEKLESAGFRDVLRIYPGLDLDLFKPGPKDPEALAALDLSPDDFVISFPGEYVRLGATDMLVDMIKRHFTGMPTSVKFVFACRIKNDADEKKKQKVKELLGSAGLLSRVRFTDSWTLPMPTLYNAADVVVFPVSNMKGKFDIPLVILEAYACGKPVILSDLEIFREFSNPKISVTVPQGDDAFLWAAIERLWHEPEERKSLGASARGFVEQSFDLKETAKKYQELYRSIS